MSGLRHQLAAYSPVGVPSLVAALAPSSFTGVTARERLADLLRRDYHADAVILLDSGTHALQYAIQLALRDVGATSPVALPAFSCYDIATAAVGADARVMLYDIDPVTLAPDAASIEAALREGARAVVVATLYGMPMDWSALQALADRHGAILIEDSAQGHGALYGSRPLGTLGRISTLSFSRGKGWTGGQGGAVLLRGVAPLSSHFNDGGAVRESANATRLAIQWMLGRPSLYGIPRAIPGIGLGETVYHAPSPMATIPRSAANALMRSRRNAEDEARSRKEVARGLLADLQDVRSIELVPVLEHSEPGYLRLPVRARGGRARFDTADAARLGIAPSYPTVLSALPEISGRMTVTGRTSGASQLAHELMTLPTHSRVKPEDIGQLVRLIRDR